MKHFCTLPLDITITSYTPKTPGRYFGPPESCYPSEHSEIEFDAYTRTGHLLTESDFGEDTWNELCIEVLTLHEEEVYEAQDEAIAYACESRRDQDLY